MKNALFYLSSLPLTPSELVELIEALKRRDGFYWVKAREELKELCSSRIEEKKERKVKALLTDDRVNQLVPVDEAIWVYIRELWNLGYSSAAISMALKRSVSACLISQKCEPVSIRKRGQVVELLDDFEKEFDLKLWRLATTGDYRQGSKITEKEKETFKELRAKGYSIAYIAKTTGRSENAVRKWVKAV